MKKINVRKCRRTLVIGFLSLSFLLGLAVAADNPVVDFYWEKARRIGKSRDPVETGATYSYIATSYYKKISRKGKVENIDSVKSEYYYSWGKLDSSKTLAGNPKKFKNLDLSVPDILDSDYNRYFFPNDTGGFELVIGFDTPTAEDQRPDGLLAIDRERYVLLWMYLFYPNKENYLRYTRSFRFTEVEGLVFPDSIWVVGSKRGIFFSENYRLETGIKDIKVYRDR